MVIVKKQAVTKRNQLKLKKDKTVKQEEDNDNENMAMAVSDEEKDDSEFESQKAEDKEHDSDLKEDDRSEDSDEGFLKEKLSNLKKKANKLKVNKEEKKEQKKLNKAKKGKKEGDALKVNKEEQKFEQTKLNKAKRGKKEGNTRNNENQAPTKVAKEDVKFVGSDKTKDNSGESREKKDARSLYIGKLSNSVTKQDLKDLSKDIVEIYFQKKTDGPNSRFAYIRFDDEATAETNYNILRGMKIKGQTLTVDYVGSKSSYNNVNLRKERNTRKLYVGDLPKDITEKELKKLSEDIVEIFISQGKKRFAFLIFDSEDKAKSNYEVLKDKKIRGQPLVMNFTSSRDSMTKTGKRSQDDDLYDGQRSAKKSRIEA